MASAANLSWIIPFLAGAVIGYILGAIYFAQLRRSVERLVTAQAPVQAAFAGVARLVLTIAAFALLAQWGVIPVIAGLVGFTVARQRAVSSAKAG